MVIWREPMERSGLMSIYKCTIPQVNLSQTTTFRLGSYMFPYPQNHIGKVVRHPKGWANGWHVKIQPEGPGWIILLFPDAANPEAEVFDEYAIDQPSLERFLQGWEIDWELKGGKWRVERGRT